MLQEGSLQRHKLGLWPWSGAPVQPHSCSYSLRPLRDPPNLRIFQSDMFILGGAGGTKLQGKGTHKSHKKTSIIAPHCFTHQVGSRGVSGKQESPGTCARLCLAGNPSPSSDPGIFTILGLDCPKVTSVHPSLWNLSQSAIKHAYT